ncbi:ABC-2 type transport system ATP-binding protein [Paenibacillus sp. SORGH_AS306]|uniref:ABC transporter ATP-binding protein n=1 Tax=Paenibacillus kyungheensis TaxID=1452732 RepID=A0AAX3LZJ6_9BACL|nr:MULTISPECIES: ABC transporter ATP-binding protein [Paenibacillus]MDQ1235823.1 ABC-2 type transport system ATP-binding protein [Paenibacillus sp. SORGH_AS_0306]MDR6112874.1 ABC-2 type transport system ATP-binding protein [Paenibacillus sp. SORGH_AS_0338]WCT55316.1 ABC transporter ATP-binding protein [Paenibacillus kyungheensis]
MENSNVIIDVQNVSMCFNMTTEKISGLKEFLIKRLKNQISYTKFWALKDVTFNVRQGELFGVLGLNGAGKSTLLKTVAGVLKPTNGTLNISGRMAPLIELGAGFDTELTARENIYLNGAILGYSKKEMNAKFDEIVDFSELAEFIDVPVKNFSSGMYARLGFAIATSTRPDILIVDEILGVGDFKFQQKCEAKINEMVKEGTSVLLVSHSIDQIRSLCNRGIILEKGQLIKEGNIEELCDFYYSKYT